MTQESRDNTGCIVPALLEQATRCAMSESTERSVASSKAESAGLTVRWKPYPKTNFGHGIFAAMCNVKVVHPLYPYT